MVCEYEIEKEGMLKIMRINCRGCKYYPSLADHRQCMESTVNKIIQSSSVDEIIFEAERNYIYDRKQTNLLNQIARAYIHLFKTEDILKHLAIPGREKCSIHFPERLHLVRRILLDLFKGDPIGAYVEAVRSVREQKATIPPSGHEACIQHTINVLSMILNTLEQMDLIKMAKPYLAGYVIGDRSIYRKFFEPQVKPSFMYTRLVSEPPIRGEEITSYKLGVGDEQSIVSVFKLPNKSRLYYHILPPEFRLGEEEYTLLEEVRDILIKYKPRREEFTDPDRMREIFFNVARDLLEEVAKNKNITLTYTRLNALADMLVRLTVGLGLVEVILQDEAIEDVYINAPAGTSPIFVKHAEYGECETNIIPNPREIEAWTSRFRMISGRPLDEANPVLDMSLNLNNVRVRISTIQQPLSPYGYGIAFRRHRARPWTLPLLIKHGSLSPMAAGLISFLIDGARTFLVAGTRGAGKTSLLSAMMVEIMRRYRVITVEDTLELPTDYLKNLGYNIQPMKVRSAITGGMSELSAADGIRTSLRLGDSSLIIGEVRSKEALALYEAMRVGALANVVAGTIHGDSPYGVYDRLINDLGVPKTSFKATDVIIVANKVRTPDQLSETRRVTSITEVRKHWENDPLREGGFLNLMQYDPKKDSLEPTRDLLEGESEIVKSVASNVREWVGNWDEVWKNIELRSKVKQLLVDISNEVGDSSILEADFVVQYNDVFHDKYKQVLEEYGSVDTNDMIEELRAWIKAKISGGL